MSTTSMNLADVEHHLDMSAAIAAEVQAKARAVANLEQSVIAACDGAPGSVCELAVGLFDMWGGNDQNLGMIWAALNERGGSIPTESLADLVKLLFFGGSEDDGPEIQFTEADAERLAHLQGLVRNGPPALAEHYAEEIRALLAKQTAADPRRPAHELVALNQIKADEFVDYKPKVDPFGWFRVPDLISEPKRVSESEFALLDDLQNWRGVDGLLRFRGIQEDAIATASATWTPLGDPNAGDGHQDAFRHAYWSALLAYEFGESFARAYGDAHEAIPGEPPEREAMDVINNGIGVSIAVANPDATQEELIQLVLEAIDRGEMVVIDPNGQLQYADLVPIGNTGTPTTTPDDTTGRAPAENDDY